ncbi:hypothetical protein [Flavobacterium sp.]|uniref:hypothetical protein n=1 Tax=Flavobacterium sp. TaxID=239 RepID=UPI00403454F4
MLLIPVLCWCQKPNDQYSIEAAYGMGISGDPGITGFSHYEIGFRYMVDEYWGIKFDHGSDKFRTGDNPELGSNYKRYSVQAVYNLGRSISLTNGGGKNINLLAHGGLGYSSLTSQTESGTDKIGNVIIGLTPQLYLNRSLALTLDTSFILNMTQHFRFDGIHPPKGDGPLKSFTGKMFNASVGLTYYFGHNKSDADWR